MSESVPTITVDQVERSQQRANSVHWVAIAFMFLGTLDRIPRLSLPPYLIAASSIGFLLALPCLLFAFYMRVRANKQRTRYIAQHDGIVCPDCYYPPDDPGETFRCTECGKVWRTKSVHHYTTPFISSTVKKPKPL